MRETAKPDILKIGETGAQPRSPRWKPWLGVAVALTTIVFLAVFSRKIPYAMLLTAWQRLSWPVLAQALGLQVLFVLFRAQRFQGLAGLTSATPRKRGDRRPWAWFGPVAAYSMTCSVFPGGSGELLLPLYLEPYGVTTGTGLGMAAGGRVLDLGWGLVLAVVLGIWLIPAARWGTMGLVLAGVAGLLAAAWLALRYAQPVVSRLSRVSWGKKIAVALEDGVKVFRTMSIRRWAWLSVVTLAIKLSSAAFYFVLARGMGFHVGFLALTVAMVFYSLFMVIPVQGIAGIGTVDAWWVVALTLVGIPLPSAIVLALTFHVVNLIYISALGGGYAIRRAVLSVPKLRRA